MAAPSPSGTVRATVNGGTIVGKQQPASADYPRAVDVFYGIPYASVERFRRAAMLPPPATGTTWANAPGPSQPCPMAAGPTSEERLRLTIVRPSSSLPRPASLPVVVYVHGGAFNFGGPLERDMAAFVAWAPADVLVVAVEYRLGALGFLHVPPDGGAGPVEANLGLRDQRLALAWVRDWVGAFGGRADEVTLMGVSAGAHAIGHQMLCPEPAPIPITKAILESGSPTARSVLDAAHPRPLAQLAALRSHARGRSLAALPLAELLDAAVLVWAENMASVCWPFQPVVDGPGGVIPRTPLELWQDRLVDGGGRLPRAVITGFCSHEGTQFVPQRAATNDDFLAFFRALIPGLTPADLAALEALYPDPTAPTADPGLRNLPQDARRGAQFRRLHEAYAHYAYVAPVLHTARSLARAGARVYLYEYAALAAPFGAASHGDHAPVVARDPAHLRARPGLAAVAAELNRRWAAFAAAPDGALADDEWPRFASPFDGDGDGVGRLLVFGRGNDEAADGSQRGVPVQARTLTRREMEQCRFWWDRMPLSQGMGVVGPRA